MPFSVHLMRQIEEVDPPVRHAIYAMLEEVERINREQVTKTDFRELKQVVQELAEALKILGDRVDRLAAAQEKTEERLDRLAATQEKTEEILKRLAAAQERTEGELQKLARSHQQLQKQVGGLSDAVGYGIEDRLMPHIPAFAAREYGVEMEDVERKNVAYADGKFDEVNLLGRCRGPEGAGFLVGECKARPGKKDADLFAAMLKRLSTVLEGRLYPVLIGYTFPPEVERYVAEKHPDLKLVKTYQVRRAAG